MKSRNLYSALAIILLILAAAMPADAQDNGELTLRLSKSFGYSLGNKMQGLFTLKVAGPPDLVRVIFYLDGQPLAEVEQSPFQAKINTDDFPLGSHMFSATGYTTGGLELRSNEIQSVFVPASEGFETGTRILIPLFVIILVAMGLSALLGASNTRKMKELALGAERDYGVTGGAICPNCKRPFRLAVFGINLSPWHKLDRCPFCGKWAVQRRRSLKELRAAEATELESAGDSLQVPPSLSEEEKLRKELDNSRYQDM